MTEATKVVAITGASGYIGSRLLRHLGEEGEVAKLVAMDTRPMPLAVHDATVYNRDVTAPIDDALGHHQVTTLVHLAFTSRQGRTRQEVRAIRQTNLKALHAVLNSCVRVNVGHVMYLSSHAVYGAHPGNAVPLAEDAALHPLMTFPFGYDKFLADQVLQTFAEQHPNVRVTVLRPCVVLGPSADNDFAKALFRAWIPTVKGHDPELQFLHEDDLVRVMASVIRLSLPGVFNVAGGGVVSYREMSDIIQGRGQDQGGNLPALLGHPAVRLGRRLGLWRDSASSWLDLVKYPIVLNTSRLEHATGYRPWHSSRDTLMDFAGAVRRGSPVSAGSGGVMKSRKSG
ncbi:MAG: NAD-dependent epimerase/dehydratase family protein [Dehalococcoidia bacterium]|nr:NAD-dependent epimerase/dehydratase family protein [Dehalococcoidia bacterium]MSQ17576.1 NAD-dependent epimerase/dehydratase family protein [Dehalococcoidia bacterium]